jgi:hypothetical protein
VSPEDFDTIELIEEVRKILPPECEVVSRISSDGKAFIVILDAAEITEHVRLSRRPAAQGPDDPADKV